MVVVCFFPAEKVVGTSVSSLVGKKSSIFLAHWLPKKKHVYWLAAWETPFFAVTVVVFVFVSRGKFSVSQLFEMINPCG